MANINDVARNAGVSIATVSRVLRDSPLVSDKARKRVLLAAHQLRYHRNLNAAALAGESSRTIGMIVPNIENPFFIELYKVVSRAVETCGYDVVLKTTQHRQELLSTCARQMIEMRVAGLVIAGGTSEQTTAELDGTKFPTIWCGGDGLRVDYVRGIQRLVKHLYDLGHRRVGIVEYPVPPSFADLRIAALRRVLSLTPQLVCQTAAADDTLEGGRIACRQLLSGSFRPTALICAHDVLAAGALRETRECGYDVPGDISVAGLDDIALAGFCVPALTTIHIRRDRIATAVCGSLFGKAVEANITCDLVVRESTARPRNDKGVRSLT
jgi:LacI family transcriptional regulator